MKAPPRTSGPDALSPRAPGLPAATLGYLERLAGFTILERLAVGAQGEIYLGSRATDGGRVAIKVLLPDRLTDPEARRGLRREAELLARIDHPNVVRHLASGIATVARGELDYLVMEHLAGRPLASRLADQEMLPEGTCVTLAHRAAEGLAAVHQAGWIHRDVKASNLLLTPDRGLVLIDFGLARDPHRDPLPPRPKGWTRSAPLAYQSPELLRGQKPDPRCDVYSLGTVLYRMATGRRPFSARTEGDLARAILKDPPPRPRALVPTLDSRFEAVILRCLEKIPARRYPSAIELATALGALSATERDESR